jgi:hypothetical protein
LKTKRDASIAGIPFFIEVRGIEAERAPPVAEKRPGRVSERRGALEAHPDMAAGEYLQLTVSDNGIGMTPETMSLIFEPFFTTKDVGKGIGMGLAIIHGIVKSHGGVITVASEPGKGSQFTVYLPLVDLESQMNIRETGIIQPGKSNGRILLVDDEEIILASVKKLLGVLGYHVVPKNSGMEAMKVFFSNPRKLRSRDY